MALSPQEVERYARHLVLKEVGGAGQAKLKSSHICLVGAGALGGPAALYLAAAGVGHITLIDDDVIEASNLQRQIQYDETDVGESKVERLAAKLTAQNPFISVTALSKRVEQADDIPACDIMLDGTDNFDTRFIVNAAAVARSIPLVSGALGRFDGQVGVFHVGVDTPCYRCFVPEAPPGAQTCAQVGIVGALAGMIGSMMALEAIKIITGAGEPLLGKLFVFDALSAKSRTLTLRKDPACKFCGKP